MTEIEPTWFEYLVVDVDKDGYPIWKGFKKDTPKEEIEKYEAYVKRKAEEYEQGVI